MKVAMLAPISWRTPPRAYGPWELVTSLLTEALVARGVDVTLFATLDSITAGKLEGVVPAPYSEDPTLDAKVWEALHVSHVFERAAEFDLIHNQADFIPLVFSRLVQTPVVTTIHGFSSPRILPTFKAYEDRVAYVAISEADKAADIRYAATIHHGIPLADFPFDPIGSQDLLFFGRMHPDKGAADAVQAAQATGRRLIMCGIVQDEGYFRREVEPHIDGERITYLGAVGGERRVKTLGAARALLHLIHFDEPFGLSVIEAMACGTPVIAWDQGALPEIIDNGVTGFVVDSVDDAVASMPALLDLDRRQVRAVFETRFSAARMARDYLAAYMRLTGIPEAKAS